MFYAPPLPSLADKYLLQELKTQRQAHLFCAFDTPQKRSVAAAAVCAGGRNKPILFAARSRVFWRRACTPVLALAKKGGNDAADKRAVLFDRANNQSQSALYSFICSAVCVLYRFIQLSWMNTIPIPCAKNSPSSTHAHSPVNPAQRGATQACTHTNHPPRLRQDRQKHQTRAAPKNSIPK